MIQGGASRQDLRPADRDPNAPIRGSHKGAAAALNVRNPQPGFVYAWGRTDQNYLIRKRNEGWEIVPPDSPERKEAETDPNWSQALDQAQTRRDVVLLRITEERYREIQEDKQRRALAARSGAAESFLDKNYQLPERYRESTSGEPVYYRAPGHGERRE